MARLIAPNGVEVDANEIDAPIFLAAGYKKPEAKAEEPKKPASKRTATRKKQAKE